ncbi:hypothetical protein BCV53_03960 [Parageobacillus thermoglucosidasius]|uniref:Uncharacterized protein n=1 Tax=Parageobacillus thermoglucosidasius TaxID=1426 RepID=A0AAN0YLL5_PARTM|nr:hypothetical protein [Parageobacillus thermoglucosidasius]GAJ43487.1 hypothetical protein GT2_10_00480 [Parageobacillus thermoglucosidasius NBRC 107763]ALF09250.1 hypothetical protein AOT13_03945 [Parageobacillus thermoglucosidasius]ANZ29333.1 hypothetical protein BCV53_03960 [Parageobacillus thermoglucosidasius]APM80071.1 hypothetical protein BCV54_03965 [Parageobacillus thermoglucosidasius]KJX69918.1 hypothetical protein WH82_03760 [Parageobacillus thermoglucosidasius]
MQDHAFSFLREKNDTEGPIIWLQLYIPADIFISLYSKIRNQSTRHDKSLLAVLPFLSFAAVRAIPRALDSGLVSGMPSRIFSLAENLF